MHFFLGMKEYCFTKQKRPDIASRRFKPKPIKKTIVLMIKL